MDMNYFEALILGIVQGITEFLPISSSGHLVLLQNLLGINETQLLFDITVHVATLGAIIFILREDIIECIKAVLYIPQALKNKNSDIEKIKNLRLLWLVFLASIPTGIIGFFLKDTFEQMFGSLLCVGIAFIITGSLLWITKRFKDQKNDYSTFPWWSAIIIGIAQGMAITPGISRSGTTIAVLLLLGMQKSIAGRFSFLMALPAITGAAILQFSSSTLDINISVLCVGFAGAIVSGYIALSWLLKIVRHGSIWKFAPYCWGIGILTIILSITRQI